MTASKRPAAHTDDSGMTLAEVIVAISIMAIVATAAISMSIASLAAATGQQRQELAVTIANQAMESVSALSPTDQPGTALSNLYTGRTEAEVNANWAANADADGVDTSYPRWDPTADGSVAPLVPITSVIKQSGTEYTTHILIGTCYQPTAGDADCTRLPGVSAPPSVTPTGMARLVRVMVVVRWTAGSTCAPDGCSYQTTSLFDSHGDLEWNIHA